MIAQGLPIYVALEPVDMRLGSERLGALVRERMRAEPRTRALFAFVSKRGHSMKVLTWDGTGTIVIHKKLDAGRFELPRGAGAERTARPGERRDLRSDPQGRRGHAARGASATNSLIEREYSCERDRVLDIGGFVRACHRPARSGRCRRRKRRS